MPSGLAARTDGEPAVASGREAVSPSLALGHTRTAGPPNPATGPASGGSYVAGPSSAGASVRAAAASATSSAPAGATFPSGAVTVASQANRWTSPVLIHLPGP
ncbi:hypothetical protein FH608_032005 [Nonomuraea phyllanthi]|uniref:Uncharacterized protein n=1 Tax=Nonomuraea phyllanthi TaxID=2219224 RepID=A0A5C4VAW2_9ACTN|nr:hypothetical protein [Nonomuraea phyllanthi]KAB8191223.1 hypothetical protein FH608_032005 [Nonomuraea phyllanthi]QFY12717.1 hypothetical protein GBF35_44610 [Nonomuraea phyllanthi]